jgi:lipoate-protein ligase B
VAAPLPVLDLGLAPYLPVQDAQARLREAVAAGRLPGVLLMLEHLPVITLGSRGSTAHLLAPEAARIRGVEVAVSERGGAVTLHAPGQLISYPILPIRDHDLRRYVWRLEEVLRLLLLDLHVQAERSPGRPGLYVGGRKIASLGLRCSRWVASHGTALNLDVDLSLFELIVSCGEPALRQTNVAELTGSHPDMAEARERYRRHFAAVFGLECQETTAVPLQGLEKALGLESGSDGRRGKMAAGQQTPII